MPRPVVFTLLAATVVFCVVQDRVTAAGARRYVTLHRAAQSGDVPPPTLDQVMRPAIRSSLVAGTLSSGAVAFAALAAAGVLRRRVSGTEPPGNRGTQLPGNTRG